MMFRRKRERERAAVVALLREYDWTHTLTIHQMIRGIGWGNLYVALAKLERAGVIESRQERPEESGPLPPRRMYRLRPGLSTGGNA